MTFEKAKIRAWDRPLENWKKPKKSISWERESNEGELKQSETAWELGYLAGHFKTDGSHLTIR